MQITIVVSAQITTRFVAGVQAAGRPAAGGPSLAGYCGSMFRLLTSSIQIGPSSRITFSK
jgi:hypothetical protein